MRKLVKNKKGVSEIVGVIIMLGMAIALFSVVYIMAITFPFNDPSPSVRITAAIDDDTVILFHKGGESLSLDTKIIFVITDKSGVQHSPFIKVPRDMLGSSDTTNSWNIGEKLLFAPNVGALAEAKITVVDVVTNSIIMQGKVRG